MPTVWRTRPAYVQPIYIRTPLYQDIDTANVYNISIAFS
jgi:hypothetical protein